MPVEFPSLTCLKKCWIEWVCNWEQSNVVRKNKLHVLLWFNTTLYHIDKSKMLCVSVEHLRNLTSLVATKNFMPHHLRMHIFICVLSCDKFLEDIWHIFFFSFESLIYGIQRYRVTYVLAYWLGLVWFKRPALHIVKIYSMISCSVSFKYLSSRFIFCTPLLTFYKLHLQKIFFKKSRVFFMKLLHTHAHTEQIKKEGSFLPNVANIRSCII